MTGDTERNVFVSNLLAELNFLTPEMEGLRFSDTSVSSATWHNITPPEDLNPQVLDSLGVWMGSIKYFWIGLTGIVVRAQDKRPAGELHTYVVRMGQNHIVRYRQILSAACSFRNRYVFPTHFVGASPLTHLRRKKLTASECSSCILEN